MRQLLTRAIVTMMAAAALALPVDAQQQGSTITLSCNGTSKLMVTSAADLKPDPITNLGIIVNVTDRTVTLMDYVTPITGISATMVSFSGQQTPVAFGKKLDPFTIDGSIDRVTGADSIMWMHKEVGNNSTWDLSCRPATRLF